MRSALGVYMVYVSDDEVTDVNELLARISESISEKCGYRTGYLRDTLSVERIVQRWPVGELEAWICQQHPSLTAFHQPRLSGFHQFSVSGF